MPSKKLFNIKTPPHWRIGQTIYYFLSWLYLNGYVSGEILRETKIADPFFMADEDLEKLYKTFLKWNHPTR